MTILSNLRALCAIALTLAASNRLSAQSKPDLIVVNANIYTVDSTQPTASAFAVRGGRVVFVGSSAGARALAGPSTRIVDVQGKTVIPGMVDAHAHLLGLATALRNVALAGSTSYEEVIRRVVARAPTIKSGEWLQGRGWDQNRWPVKEFPTHEALSKATPNIPVVLTRIDGHALLANAAAMRLAGITAATKDPDGGRIIRLPNGDPSGVFVDNAQGLIRRAVPSSSTATLRDATVDAIAECNRWGLIGLHDAGEPRRAIEIFESLAQNNQFNLRAYVMVSDNAPDISYYTTRGPKSGLYNGHIWVRAIKTYADGALGSRGAALLAPYSDDPGNVGLLVSTPEHLEQVAETGLRSGFQVNTHAIGDRGNRVALDAFEAALKKVPKSDHRFRVEHAQVLSPEDIPRFKKLGVIPSMQASHQTSDMRWAEARVGPQRIRGAYAWRTLLNTGVIIPNGSDFPVEEVNPLISFHSAVTRQDATNWPAGGWYPDQVMTREEALKSMTIWPAYAAFQEKEMGSLSNGKYADFVVLDRDIMKVPGSEILKTRVLSTWIGGKRVYQAK
ncbi:MAG TPA: amidohydrolase [Gemmatimonadaceae bacterium]|nr:amidohydrolase [Gemmatimonadaceae bacterium]